MKSLLRYAGYSFFVFLVLMFAGVLIANEKLPATVPSKEGDELARKMLKALNYEGWEKLKYLTWTFRDKNKYIWDKKSNVAVISWDEYKVVLNLSKVTGVAYKNNIILTDVEHKECIDKAWSKWCNDSFWMFAPFKVFDPGTTRSIVPDSGATFGLMVSYSSGGVTPGDSYLWLLDKNYVPLGFKMWVKVIPIGGTHFTWENWVNLPCGAKVSQTHKHTARQLDLTDIKEGNTLKDLGVDENIFNVISI